MNESAHEHHQLDTEDPKGGIRWGRWIFLGFALIAAYFLYTEHRAHVVPYLPFLLILACPLLHLFHGHGGHGGHAHKDGKGDGR
jgi:hypothetical protein